LDKIHDSIFGKMCGEFAMSSYNRSHDSESVWLVVLFLGVTGTVFLLVVLTH